MTKEDIFITLLVFVCAFLIGAMVSFVTYGIAYKDGQVNAINGQLDFEKVITYEKVDTVFVATDSSYVEIK